MEGKSKIQIAVGSTGVIALTYFVVRYVVRKNQMKTGTKKKLVSKLFGVPFVESKYQDLEEQTENKETTNGIEFR